MAVNEALRRTKTGSSLEYLLVLWFWALSGEFLSLLPATMRGIGIALLLFLLGRKFTTTFLANKIVQVVIAILLIPLFPALLRPDPTAITEILGNLGLGLAFIMLILSRKPSHLVCRDYFFFLVLPLCILGYVTRYGSSPLPFLATLSPLDRGPLISYFGGTNAFLGFSSALYTLESVFYRRKTDIILGFIFLFSSGKTAAILPVIIAVSLPFVIDLVRSTLSFLKLSSSRFFASLATLCVLIGALASFMFATATGFDIERATGITRNPDAAPQYTALTGRDTLWAYNFSTFFRFPYVGGGSEAVRFNRRDGEVYYLDDGSTTLAAGTESYFDYYLARDGIWGLAYPFAWLIALWWSVARNQRNLQTLLIFGFIAAYMEGFMKISYSPIAFIYLSLAISTMQPQWLYQDHAHLRSAKS